MNSGVLFSSSDEGGGFMYKDSSEDDSREHLAVDLANSENPTKTCVTLKSVIILSAEFCERAAFASVAGSLILYFFDNLQYSKGVSNALYLVWAGTCFISPLFSGWLADAWLGRFRATAIFLSIYTLGMGFLTIGSIDDLSVLSKNSLSMLGLILIAIGTGLKSVVVTFGADQFSPNSLEKRSFFHWFYFCINLGSVLGFSVVAYIQEFYSFTIGFIIPAGALVISLLFFLSATTLYMKTPPDGSIISRGLSIVWASLCAPEDVKKSTNDFLRRAIVLTDDQGNQLYDLEEVQILELFLRILPMLTPFVVFWMLCAQTTSTFFTQGTVLRLQTGGFAFPVASLNLITILGVLIFIPVFEKLVYPCFRAINVEVTMVRRMAIGFLMATLAVLYAGCLEVVRLKQYHEDNTIIQTVGSLNVTAVDLSVLTQAPAYLLMAIAEVLAIVTGLEFAYSQAPPSMRSVVVAVFYFTAALGNFLGAALIMVLNAITHTSQWIGSDLNESHMDLYFFCLAAIGFVNFFLYLPLSQYYQFIDYQFSETSTSVDFASDSHSDFSDSSVSLSHRERTIVKIDAFSPLVGPRHPATPSKTRRGSLAWSYSKHNLLSSSESSTQG